MFHGKGSVVNLISCTKIFSVDTNASKEEFDLQTDAIADALFDLEQVNAQLKDSAVGVDLSAKILEITVTVEHSSIDEGQAAATLFINQALKQAGGESSANALTMTQTSQAAKLLAA